MKNLNLFLCFIVLFHETSFSKESICQEAHKQAVKQCKAHEHGITASQISQISIATRNRVAEKEADKLYAMGRACAMAQKNCQTACVKTLTNEGSDIAQSIDLQGDCAEGEVAQQRSALAKKYLEMKAVLEASRTPANR